MKTIDVANDFSKNPSGRYISDGSTSGETFLKNILIPAKNTHKHVSLDFNGVRGYGSSFLEEAFGGLVRETKMTAEEFHDKFTIVSDDELLKHEIEQYLTEETQRLG